MSEIKQKRRKTKEYLSEARSILAHMEKHVNSKDDLAIDLAYAFCSVLNYHLEHGDLRPDNVHLAALLRRNCNEV